MRFWKQPYLFIQWFNDAKCMKFFTFIYFISTHIREKINDERENFYVQNQYYLNLQKIRISQVCTT